MNNIFVWKNGERLAENYLKKLGYKILEKNARNRYAEIDIIAEDDEDVVFVEVKSRTSAKYGLPSEAVDRKKQRGYIMFAQCYVVAKRMADKNIRFDVIEILDDQINHILSAFDGNIY